MYVIDYYYYYYYFRVKRTSTVDKSFLHDFRTFVRTGLEPPEKNSLNLHGSARDEYLISSSTKTLAQYNLVGDDPRRRREREPVSQWPLISSPPIRLKSQFA